MNKKTEIKKLRKIISEQNADLTLAHEEFEKLLNIYFQLKSANVDLKKEIAKLSIILMEHLGCTEKDIYNKSHDILCKRKKEGTLINPFG